MQMVTSLRYGLAWYPAENCAIAGLSERHCFILHETACASLFGPILVPMQRATATVKSPFSRRHSWMMLDRCSAQSCFPKDRDQKSEFLQGL